MTEIVEVKDFIPAYTDAVQKLLEQLTNRPVKLTGTTLRKIISQENTHLFFLLADQEIAGMLTVGIYHSPTGGKAWIEDVVVDEKYRGQGLSKQLVTHAVRFVKEQGIPLIMLTSNPTRIIRHSLPKDLDAIIEIFHYARQFMKEHGNPNQWINGYPSAELILREITNGTNYVCENENGEIIGTFCFIPGEDPTYARIDDGNWLNNEPYYVIHRMATNGKQKGVADACLKWCFEHCNNIRVDTHHDNLVMQNILKKYGFRRCGIIYTHNGTSRIAYQRTLTEKELSLPTE